ncbi:hypothetical protein B0H13DRAFT_2424284 [Mycena leptocephala]|nr:hypothetical protein B0H13DRAFT_2424284 [Mycena leptocephala]
MFSGTGHHIHGGNFYNVAGDISLQTHHHLTVQNHESHTVAFGLTSGREDDRVGGSHQQVMIQEDDQPPAGSTLGLDTLAAGSDSHGWARVASNPARSMAVRPAPYGMPFRPRGPKAYSEEAYQGSSSLKSSALISSSGGLPRSVSIPRLNYPAPGASTSLPYLNPRHPMTNSQKQYPARYSHSDGLIASSDFSTGPHKDQQAIHDSSPPSFNPAYTPDSTDANQPSIHGGTFIIANNVHGSHEEAGINILHRAVALDALYDSADSFPQPRCHPETRTQMLDDLLEWAVQDKLSQPIRWLHGPAGAGKSAIMQTLCQKLQDLALNTRDLKHLISHSVEDDPSVVGRHMEVQLRKLIVQPCIYQSLRDSVPLNLILLIDGLDECDTHGAQAEILRLVASAVRQLPNTFRVLIASRPEVHIREIFDQSSFHGILKSVNVDQSFADVRKYLCDEFARIHREHRDTMGNVPTPWPPPDVLNSLVSKSSGYFVYASTIIKFVDDKYFRPTEQLAVIQNLIPSDSDPPFEFLDKLYIQILSGVPARFRSRLCDILYCVISEWDLDLTPLQIDWLLELKPGDTQLIFRGLHSVLEIGSNGHISVYHASFLDFVRDPRRSSNFNIGSENRMNVARAVLKALSSDSHWLDVDDSWLAPRNNTFC